MKILKSEINWYKGYGNSPVLEVTVDSLPDHENDLRYVTKEVSGNGKAYFSMHKSGYVNFFYHDFHNQRGYDGAVFTGKLVDGSDFSVKGPWSSNSSAMNSLGFIPTLECTFNIKDKYKVAGHILQSLAIILIFNAGADYEHHDNTIRIKKRGMTFEQSQTFKNL